MRTSNRDAESPQLPSPTKGQPENERECCPPDSPQTPCALRAEASSVIVFRPSSLGDALVSLPAIEAIRRLVPGAPLVLLTDGRAREVFEATRYFSEIFVYPRSLSAPGDWSDLWRVARRVRALRPARLYYLPLVPRSEWQVRRDALFWRILCGIADIRGLAAAEPPVADRDADGRPVRWVPEWLRLLRVVGGAAGEEAFLLATHEAERLTIDSIWRERGVRPADRVIALAPGSKLATKRWPVGHYVALAHKLLSLSPDLRLVIVGGREDSDAARAIAESLDARVINCAGRLTVVESAEALRRCSLYVGNDSGPMHLAAAVGTRCVAIFSARDKRGVWEPYGGGHVILRKEVPCAGCQLAVCEKEALKCLTSISVEEVFHACRSALAARHDHRAGAAARPDARERNGREPGAGARHS